MVMLVLQRRLLGELILDQRPQESILSLLYPNFH